MFLSDSIFSKLPIFLFLTGSNRHFTKFIFLRWHLINATRSILTKSKIAKKKQIVFRN